MRFVTVGGTCVLLNAALFAYFVNHLGWSYLAVTVLAFFALNGAGFLLHRLWTFRAVFAPVRKQIGRFFGVQAASLGLNLLLMWALVGRGGANPVLASVLASVILAAANFLAQRFWTFRRGRPAS